MLTFESTSRVRFFLSIFNLVLVSQIDVGAVESMDVMAFSVAF